MDIPYLANYSEESKMKASKFIYNSELQLNVFKDDKNRREVVASFINSYLRKKGTKIVGKKKVILDPTMQTATLEPSDPDDFLFGPTSSTRSIEPSDPDEINLGPTTLTENVESADPDEFIMGPTTITKTGGEPSDPDEIIT
ncbi:MAG: hypothetical protein GY737_10300 [Desulfobacteraceae bacterium]|nr:hypothetical protein [Desulfobacteraceae bacterium]